MKTILIMPAIEDHINVIQLAREKGYRVITCDNVPGNAGHQYADKSYDIDLFDYAGLIKMAEEECIDAVWGYATDIGALAAAKVSDSLGLNSVPFETVNMMCDKSLFRQFLSDNDFNTPKFVQTCSEPLDITHSLSLPVIVKPVDRASSKGIKIVDVIEDFSAAFKFALDASICKKVIVEEFIGCDGYQLHGDVIVEDGLITCFGIGDHLFTYDHNSVASTGTIFPSSHSGQTYDILRADVQRFINLSGFTSGAINVEARMYEGELYIIELGPRSGGNYTPELLSHIYQRNIPLDLLSLTMGVKGVFDCVSNGDSYGLFILRATKDGVLKSVNTSSQFEILEKFDLKQLGTTVSQESGPNNIISILIIKCTSKQMLRDIFHEPSRYFDVVID